MLDSVGFQVIEQASNGKEAVEKFRSFNVKPDIIIMDHRMPIKNGLEAAKEILEIDNKTRILFASADSSIKDEALSLGAKRFLEKPFNYEEFIAYMKEIQQVS